MAEPFTVDAGAHYAFALSPEQLEGTICSIGIVFETSDRRVSPAGTETMPPTKDCAEDFCDAPNAHLGSDQDGQTGVAQRIFAAPAKE